MKRKKILFVDNRADFLRTRTPLLKEAGYDVTPVSTIEEAREALRSQKFDLAILDLRLERENDPEDISGLRLAQEMTPWMPKIILSSFPNAEAVREALKIGPEGIPAAVDFVNKADGIEALKQSIRRALGLDLAWLRSVHSTDEDLERDYREAQGQARLMFVLSMIFIGLGTLFLFSSLTIVVSLLSRTQADATWMTPLAGLLTAIGGVIAQTAGVLFFSRVDKANKRIEHYHDERLSGQRFEILLNACEDLGDHSEMSRVHVVQAAAASWMGPHTENDEKVVRAKPILTKE